MLKVIKRYVWRAGTTGATPIEMVIMALVDAAKMGVIRSACVALDFRRGVEYGGFAYVADVHRPMSRCRFRKRE